MDLQCDLKHFDELSTREIYDLLHLRDLVFVVGQKITAEPEVDGRDPECVHARIFDGAQLLGTARIFADQRPLVVGRVAVHPDRQRGGVGTVLMRHIQAWLGERPAELHAQAHLEAWYTSLGWQRVGDAFEEADIPHVMMVFNA